MKKRVNIFLVVLIALVCVLNLTACGLSVDGGDTDWGEWAVTSAATCENGGIETRVSKIDSTIIETRSVAASGHNWDEWEITTEPTCLVSGVETRVCKDCGNRDVRPVVELGHNWGEWVVTTKPTCATPGIETRVCNRDDNHIDRRSISLSGHDWSAWVIKTAPTCTTQGIETRICRNDNAHSETRFVSALGHDWGEWVVTPAPNEIGNGMETRTCRNNKNHIQKRNGQNGYCNTCEMNNCGISHGALSSNIFGEEVKDYKDYLDFSSEKPNVYLELVEIVIKDGKLTPENQAKYEGFVRSTGGTIDGQLAYFVSASGIDGRFYQVTLKNDLTVHSFSVTTMFNSGEIKQTEYTFTPIKDNNGKIVDYYLSSASSYIVVDMGDGKTASCSVDVLYKQEVTPNTWWTGTAHRDFNYLSYVRITVDFNNVYTEGRNDLFYGIYLITDIAGTWDLINVWEEYRELSLTKYQKPGDNISRPTIILF